MTSLRRAWGVALLVAAFSALALVGCDEPQADDSPVELGRFPHVLDIASRWTPDLTRVETRVIDFGTPESHAFLADDWADDGVFENDGSTFTWSPGKGSTLRFTSFERRRLTLTARLRPYRIDGPPQKVEIELNGQPVEVLRLKGGMRTYQFKLPAEALARGSNELILRNIYPDNIGPGPPDLGPPGAAWDYLRFDSGQAVKRPEVEGDVLVLPFGAEARFYVELTDAAVLSIERLESSHRDGYLDIHLRTHGDDDELSEHQMWASTRSRHWELAAALDRSANKRVLIELSLRAIGGPRAKEGQDLRLHRPQLRCVAEMASAQRPSTGQRSTGQRSTGQTLPGDRTAAENPRLAEAPNILIYLVDTLRADHLGCYGYDRGTSPRIDAFAADAILFENAHANSSWTRSTVASLFTGRLPPSHGVHGRGDALSEQAATLAEVLYQGGYTTAALITNGNVSEQVGFGQGFETFRLLKGSSQNHHALSDTLHRAAVNWLDQPRKRPFFLYLHTIDPHTPYAPPRLAAQKLAPTLRAPGLTSEIHEELAAFRQRVGELSSQPIQPGSLTWLHGLQSGLIEVTDDITDDLISLYDAEILFNDFFFGKLVDHLKKTGLYENTILIMVSDHGEEFHDHQSWEHGRTLYQEQIRVPLIVRFPAGPHGVRLDASAQQIDLLPTLADVLDLPVPDGVQGESLWPRVLDADGPDRPPRVVYSQLELDGFSAESLIRGRFKLVCAHSRPVGCRLFDLEQDPGEKIDLASRRPVMTGYLQQLLRSFQPEDGGLKAPRAQEDAEVLKNLRALGYL